MLTELSKNWWLFLIRGIFTVLLGIALIAWPGMTLKVMVLLFGIFSLLGGIISMITSLLSIRKQKRWWLIFLEGLLSVIIGGIVLQWPGMTFAIFVWIIMIWAIVSGIIQIILAIMVRDEIENEWLLGLMGVLSLVIGLVLISNPLTGLLVMTWLLGFNAIIAGVLIVAFSFALKAENKK